MPILVGRSHSGELRPRFLFKRLLLSHNFRQLSEFSGSSEIHCQSQFWAAPPWEILHLIFCWLFWSSLTTPSSSLLCWTMPAFEVGRWLWGERDFIFTCSVLLANINGQQCLRPSVPTALSSQQHRSLLLHRSHLGHQHWKVRMSHWAFLYTVVKYKYIQIKSEVLPDKLLCMYVKEEIFETFSA